jgi:hypothetical protein
MMTKLHFEDLWSNAESYHTDTINVDSVQLIIDEIMMKLNIYKAIDSRLEISQQEKNNIKSKTIGEILFSLTNLSLKDNINVFESLLDSINSRGINITK